MAKARQIPSLCFAPTGSPITSNITLTPPLSLERFASTWPTANQPKPHQYVHIPTGSVSQDSSTSFETASLMRNPPSPTLPEPIESLGIIDSHIERLRANASPRAPTVAQTAPVEQKRNGLFNIKWPGSKTKTEGKKAPPKSTYSQESNDSELPKFMAFAFALTGNALLVWKKDSEALVRIELETSVHRYINLGEMLPGKPNMDRMASIRFAVEGSEWISAIVAHTVANQRVSCIAPRLLPSVPNLTTRFNTSVAAISLHLTLQRLGRTFKYIPSRRSNRSPLPRHFAKQRLRRHRLRDESSAPPLPGHRAAVVEDVAHPRPHEPFDGEISGAQLLGR
jgi:hypothetical protein